MRPCHDGMGIVTRLTRSVDPVGNGHAPVGFNADLIPGVAAVDGAGAAGVCGAASFFAAAASGAVAFFATGLAAAAFGAAAFFTAGLRRQPSAQRFFSRRVGGGSLRSSGFSRRVWRQPLFAQSSFFHGGFGGKQPRRSGFLRGGFYGSSLWRSGFFTAGFAAAAFAFAFFAAGFGGSSLWRSGFLHGGFGGSGLRCGGFLRGGLGSGYLWRSGLFTVGLAAAAFGAGSFFRAEEYYHKIAYQIGYARYGNFWTWNDRVRIIVYPDQKVFMMETQQPFGQRKCDTA